MKSLNQLEVENLVGFIDEKLKGSQLQGVESFEQGLLMEFYQRGNGGGHGEHFLVVDMSPLCPMMLLFDHRPVRWPKKMKPVGLFLNSNGCNLFVMSLQVIPQKGRVLSMILSNSESKCEVEFHLIPKAPNLIVRSGKKEISWNKPKELAPFEAVEVTEARSIPSLHAEWSEGMKPSPAGLSGEKIRKQLMKDIEKKKKALQEIERGLNSNESQQWYQLGEKLKVGSMTELGSDWEPYLDRKRSQKWNLEQAFNKAKNLEKKKSGTEERRKLLMAEVQHLEDNLEAEIQRRTRPPDSKALFRKELENVRVRKKTLASGATAYLGKSAQDNMRLLRQSQAWDYWMHLRDYPSAHIVIQRNKNQNLSQGELEQMARWMAEETLSKKVLLPGTRLSVIYTECRFVRPIKGDKLGRVHYQNERHFLAVI